MNIAELFKTIRNTCRVLASCSVSIGKNPDAVCTPAIILFPHQPLQLNCGFAGLMTVRLPKETWKAKTDDILIQLWRKIKNAGLKSILDGNISADHYFSGLDSISAAEEATLDLKRESVQEVLFFDAQRAEKLRTLAEETKSFLAAEEKLLEEKAAGIQSADLEIVNSRLVLLKDIQWILEKDVLANLEKIMTLTGQMKPSAVNPAVFRKYRKMNLLLNAVDRLEVRGRDSAGIQIAFSLAQEKDLEDILVHIREENLFSSYLTRSREGDLLNHSIAVSTGKTKNITFTYKTFSIVGELGRNVADLRKSIQHDAILHCFAHADTVCETTLTHTRWASVGSITEENCHPVNNHKPGQTNQSYPFYSESTAGIHVVLNGDVDNYPALRQALEAGNHELIATQVTTDTKIIPLQIEKYLLAGQNLTESFRLAVNDFDGSHAIAMQSDLEPGKMFLALKGSGQSIYIGMNADQYMFSSELYGLVEVMPRFIKMNGEASGESPASGQIFILDQNSAGSLTGISACYYDGSPITLRESSVQKAEITTRDIDRGAYPHYFLKEISESALSIKRTLRGKYRIVSAENVSPQVLFNLGNDIVPAPVRSGLMGGAVKNIIVIGHGTAAVAGAAVADALELYLKDKHLNIMARVASELSGFGLKDDLSDTLIIAITQSGTTTDTNRAVAMARERGALIISIVNRRQSDITSKSHGVFYTSDGRDIEMSVASTKAFYSQIVAGQVLALFFAQLLKVKTDEYIAAQLHNLESAPQLMGRIFARRDQIAASVQNTFTKKFWAIVGSGPNKAAADEIRIKLSELCYKTISSDIVENKKHIDLSAEPLILVCAAGNPEPVVEDVVKDVAIFKAHKAAVVVFAEEGDERFSKIADAVIPIPVSFGPLPVILNTMAGHLWGYFAACAIDQEAHIFREFRNRLNLAMTRQTSHQYSLYDRIADIASRRMINEFSAIFNRHCNEDAFHLLNIKTMSDLVLLLKYVAGKLPLEDLRHDFKSDNGFTSPFELLDITLGTAIDELARPIDAIRHQAKTVTVGTSRKEKELKGIVFDLLETLKFAARHLTYRNVLTINRIQPAIAAIRGYTVYDVSHLDDQGNPAADSTIVIRTKAGIAAKIKSRADQAALLMGTKRMIVSTGHVYIGKGKTDGATIVVMPLLGENNLISHLLLLHVDYNEELPLSQKKDVLGYRYNDVQNLVTEYNINWDDHYLDKISLADLFTEPVDVLAGQIKQRVLSGR
jgi:glutamine---fructose-6-phosphate transaminase (isomerizing)